MMIKKRIHLVTNIIFFLILSNISLLSQLAFEPSKFSFGVTTGLDFVTHIVDIKNLPNVESCCPHYNEGNGNGIYLGVFADSRFDTWSHITFNIAYNRITGDLTSPEFKWIEFNNNAYLAEVDHHLKTTFNLFSIEPSYKYGTPIGLYFGIGFNLNLLFQSSYEQKEMLIKPENEGTFENGKRIRNELSGTISNTKLFLFFVKMYAEYDFKINKSETLYLSPKFSYSYGLNSIFGDHKWKISMFSLGLQLKYNPLIERSSPLEPK